MSQDMSSKNEKAMTPASKKNWTMGLILLVSVLPIALAYFAYFTGIGVPKETVNAGKLLPNPMPLNELLDETTAEPFLSDKKWRLFIPLTKNCTEECQNNFYTTRQVHILLGEKSIRVDRIAVNNGGETGKKYFNEISAEHPRLKYLEIDQYKWRDWVNRTNAALYHDNTHYYLLLDQEGNAIMAYNKNQTGNQLLKDIKRALKYSIDYQ